MVLSGFGVLLVAFVVLFAWKGWQSQTPPPLGLVDGQLRACPDKPNCVSSLAPASDSQHVIPPLPAVSWNAARRAVEAAGGHVLQDNGDYLHATFTSRIFRFVDDVELCRDAPDGVIQVRSASRVGQSDFGVNRKRVEALRQALQP